MKIIQLLAAKQAAKFALAGVAMTIGAVQTYRPMVFVGESMSPTYQNHEITLTEPFSGRPYQGEVVTMQEDGSTIVKRIAYVPGDHYYQVRVGSEWEDATTYNLGRNPGRFANMIRKVTVPQGYVYVLGDNQTVSVDSRTFGFVPIANIQRQLVDQRPRAEDLTVGIVLHERPMPVAENQRRIKNN